MDFKIDQAPEVSVWIRFPKLPIQYWSGEALSKLANKLGKPVEMDMMTKNKSQSNFAWVKIKMIVGIVLQEVVTYAYEGDRIIEQRV